jgi:hypothetical protein
MGGDAVVIEFEGEIYLRHDMFGNPVLPTPVFLIPGFFTTEPDDSAGDEPIA